MRLARGLDIEIGWPWLVALTIAVAGTAGYLTHRSHLEPAKPLQTAVVRGEIETVRALLAEGADPNEIGLAKCTPLHYASRDGHEEAVRLLLAAGANTEVVGLGLTPVEMAARGGHRRVVELLAAAGAGCSVHGVLQMDNHSDLLLAMLAKGTPLDTLDARGDTPLHVAISLGSEADVALLLAAGANANAEGHYGSRPIEIAWMQQETGLVALLIAGGADLPVRLLQPHASPAVLARVDSARLTLESAESRLSVARAESGTSQ